MPSQEVEMGDAGDTSGKAAVDRINATQNLAAQQQQQQQQQAQRAKQNVQSRGNGPQSSSTGMRSDAQEWEWLTMSL